MKFFHFPCGNVNTNSAINRMAFEFAFKNINNKQEKPT